MSNQQNTESSGQGLRCSRRKEALTYYGSSRLRIMQPPYVGCYARHHISGLALVTLLVIISAFLILSLTSVSSQEQSNTVALEALSRLKGIDLESNPAVKNAVLKILDQVKGTPQFVEVVRDFKITGQESALLDFACKQPASSTAAEAVRIALHSDRTNLMFEALDGTNVAPLVEALGNTGEKEIVPLLEPRLVDNAHDSLFHRKAAHALSGVREGAELLLRLAKEQ